MRLTRYLDDFDYVRFVEVITGTTDMTEEPEVFTLQNARRVYGYEFLTVGADFYYLEVCTPLLTSVDLNDVSYTLYDNRVTLCGTDEDGDRHTLTVIPLEE